VIAQHWENDIGEFKSIVAVSEPVKLEQWHSFQTLPDWQCISFIPINKTEVQDLNMVKLFSSVLVFSNFLLK
jgi:hypothetical protein